jgi:hypothetical protein
LVRDGTQSDENDDVTDRIPDTEDAALETNENGPEYGLNEPYHNYASCRQRERNKGLYIADRNLNNGEGAMATRQNNGGNRHGYECNEERDYYPYWHPTVWMDAAILAHNTEWCQFYQDNSQNAMDKGVCYSKEEAGKSLADRKFPFGDVPQNNPTSCAQEGNVWEMYPAWNIPKPDCVQAPWARHNHLGNGNNGFANSYNWTMPTLAMANENNPLDCIEGDNCNCVLRLRYNISTGDVGETEAANPAMNFLTSAHNGKASPVSQDKIVDQDGLPHELALNTNQYGRTFQDRSFVFHIRQRPAGVTPLNRIHNLNVRGKRGNIVQTYPATEYDFVPSYLHVRASDYIHFQWTGCDNNAANQAGEGTDRMIVPTSFN